ncbi:MAG TPA: class I mannose-6-phosphate isomerase [Bryobacteraceae bacterium]|nr:class I mannose-6-phosphate isomerase [Bryobacteraceae bacterium]
MSVRLLEPEFVERVWGTTRLAPLFPDQPKEIGEVWFNAGPAFPVLVKFIFTSQRLSVQVHPKDAYARQAENSRGKTEMWHILAAEPGATIALGFNEPQTTDSLRAAIADGSVEKLLNWVPVKPGDTYFAEAGTVHAIGAGITLCEIQQNSDVTYRLYDYGRPRELHLEKGLAVADTHPYDGRRDYPIVCDHFNVDLLEIDAPVSCSAGCDGTLIVLEGSGAFDDTAVGAGQVALVTAGSEPVRVTPSGKLKILHAKCSSET